MSRYAPRHSTIAYSLGPGPMTLRSSGSSSRTSRYVATLVSQALIPLLGLIPEMVIKRF